MRKISWEKDFLNAEENSIETFTAILAWINSFGNNDTSESSQEEIDEKIDLIFHTWIPTLNRQFEIIELMKTSPHGETLRDIYQPEKVPVAKKPITRHDFMDYFECLNENYDSDTVLIDFDQILSKVTTTGMQMTVATIAFGIMEAGDGVDEFEASILDRIMETYGLADTDLGIMAGWLGISEEEGDENCITSESNRAFYRKHYKQLEEIESLKEYNKELNRLSKETWSELKQSDGGHSGNCFIATVCLDSDSEELYTLREFRDGILSKTISGQLFIKLYYKYGSYLANIIDKSESAKSVVRKVLLTPLVNYSRRKIKETSKSD